MNRFELKELDEEVDRIIKTYTATSGLANLLTVPPVDTIMVTTQIAIMGVKIGSVYGFQLTKNDLMAQAKLILRGAGASAVAANAYVGIAKLIPGLNVFAMFSQPFVTALICNTAGKEYKKYFHRKLGFNEI